MLIKYLILGVVQGLTEFLPVSSSGHLVILQRYLSLDENGCLVGVMLHLGTLLALSVFFFNDIKKITCDFFKRRNTKIVTYLAIVTLITGLSGILGRDFFKEFFSSPRKVCLMLIVTGIVLLFTKKFTTNKRNFSELTIKDALWLGITQSLAIIPGISRSGITISTLLFRGVNKESAFRFSFLAAIPVILGAFILESNGLSRLPGPVIIYLLAGTLAAFLSGLAALQILFTVIQKAKFSWFGYYCLAIGTMFLFIL